jgi:hypothetical protein
MSRQKTQALRNLSRRLAKPAPVAFKGPADALWAVGEASTSEIIEWAYARRLLMLGDQRKNGFNRVARRALKQIGAGAGLCESGDTDDDQVDRHDVVTSSIGEEHQVARRRVPGAPADRTSGHANGSAGLSALAAAL